MALATHTTETRGAYRHNQTATHRDSVNRWLALIQTAFAVARQRRRLRSLDDRLLKDIGLSRADAEREGGRALWDLPEYAKRRQ